MNNKLLLIVGVTLLGVGLLKPNLNLSINKPDNIVIVTAPSDSELRSKCKFVIDCFANGSSDRVKDGHRLSDLYMDLATLIELEGNDEVIKTTDDIRQSNSLCGAMLRMNIKGKYPGLADAAQLVIVSQIGDDSAPLNAELRTKAVNAFRALAWACNEGAK